MKTRIAAWIGRLQRVFNLWLLLAFFLCAGACLLAADAALIFARVRGHLSDGCAAAQSAYERGGTAQLLSLLRGLDTGPGMRIHLADARGHDLASGEDVSGLLAATHRNPILPPRSAPIVLVQTPRYLCVIEPPAHLPRVPFGPMFWVLPFLSILCCTFGVYVTYRMRRIEAVVHHFGSGQLAVRAAAGSGDSIGRLARAFNQMAERIESLVESHRQLCTDMAHELRSPLTRLLLAVPLARSGAPGALGRIEMEAGRVKELVDELLEVARAEADPAVLQLEPIDLQQFLTEVADHCSIEAVESGCRVQMALHQPGIVTGDAELLRRAIENVVRNAVQHSPAGARIELCGEGGAESATIWVRDWGPGVPESALQDIFRPFFRVEPSRRSSDSGAGLGLAIAQRAIALHRGTIRAENCKPGLRVCIQLPRNR